MEGLAIALPVLSIVLLGIVFLYRRFRRAVPDMPRACAVAGAVALSFGIVNVITGVAHSAAVASLALREPEYGALQILRFTTGLMLVYSGAMTVALYRGIKAGHRSAIVVGAATGLLFVLYLVFLLPLAGTEETVPPMLALWSLYLACLGAAATARLRPTPAS